MQINLETYQSQDFKCPNCQWQGKDSELDTENISEEHWIIDFECPKCSEHIGSGQARLRTADEISQKSNQNGQK